MEDEGTLAARCSVCGLVPEQAPPFGWSLEVGPAGPQWVCGGCTRHNLRAIEGKLDRTWW